MSQKEEEEQIQLEESTIEQMIRSAQADPQLTPIRSEGRHIADWR
jgi:hypothetical protein